MEEDSELLVQREEWVIETLELLSRTPSSSSSEASNSTEEDEESSTVMKIKEKWSRRSEEARFRTLAKEVESVCNECEETIDTTLVSCTQCKLLYHWECASLKNDPNDDWFCSIECRRYSEQGRKRSLDDVHLEDRILKSGVFPAHSKEDDECYSPDEDIRKSPAKIRRLGAKKPRWTPEEDIKLLELKKRYGDMSWAKISQNMDERTSSQCYQRWHRVLNPAIQKGPWSKEETETLARVVKELDADKISWSQVAKHIPGRTDIQCRYQYLKLVRTGKQKFGKQRSGNPSEETRRNPQRKRKQSRHESEEEDIMEDEALF